jgi:hypothetical protein
MSWLPISEAPRDGTPVLLRGGKDEDNFCFPVVVGRWEDINEEMYSSEKDEYIFIEGLWYYAFWDSAWRSVYSNPTHFMYIPDFEEYVVTGIILHEPSGYPNLGPFGQIID